MLRKRYRDERGAVDAGWLKSKHSFSFGHYHDPDHMGFGPLRVINEDRVIPGAGFGTHPHDNMEIISYVLSGALAHKDSMGTGSTIKAGDVQLMSAGTGVTHSEFNASNENEAHFLQIWITPRERGTAPEYQQKSVEPQDVKNKFHVVISPDGTQGALAIKQDARMSIGRFDEGMELNLPLDAGRKYWLQLAQGLAEVAGDKASTGDGFAIEGEEAVMLRAITDAEMILFELPA